MESRNLTGYGLAILQNENKNVGSGGYPGVTALAVYYGRNIGHGHNDNLNLHLFSFDIDLSPDLGNPEHKDEYDMMRRYFINNCIAHNTVMVDRAQQEPVIASDPLHFEGDGWVKLIDVDAHNAYKATSEYRRTSVLVKYSDEYSYIVDFFKVKGGSEHIYSLHSAESSGYVSKGLELVPQTNSSGEYVGTMYSESVGWGENKDPSGFQYFTKIRNAKNKIDGFTMAGAECLISFVNVPWSCSKSECCHVFLLFIV